MPLYHYHCGGSCEEFTRVRKISECALPEKCPICKKTAPRTLKAPFLNTMAKNTRIAHQCNERSADSPRVESLPAGRPIQQGHGGGGHGHHHRPSRPWMIGH